MEIPRRNVLALGAAGVAGLAGGQALGGPAAASPAGAVGAAVEAGARATATLRQMLSGTDKDHPVVWDFMVTNGRNKDVWSTLPVPSHWEFHGFGTYTSGWTILP